MRRLLTALLVGAANVGAWLLHLPCDHDDDWQGIT